MKKTYYGYWSTGSSYNCPGYEFSNLKKARKEMRAIARGNNTGSGAQWWIMDYGMGDQYPGEHTVASGRV